MEMDVQKFINGLLYCDSKIETLLQRSLSDYIELSCEHSGLAITFL
jgi:hypothetical protein